MKITDSATPRQPTPTVPENAFSCLDSWRARRSEAGRLLVALDFDGTISPIVLHPPDARMAEGAREAIELLLKRDDTDVAMVSGRRLEDLRARVDIPGLFYSGNHGLQIEGPGVHQTRPEALTLLPRVRAMRDLLAERLRGIPGVFIEDKEFSLSIHYRGVTAQSEQQRVITAVQGTHMAHGTGLKLTYGKCIVEVRPDIDWNKGHATLYLVECIERARGAPSFTLFLGDDRTDEDAFAAIRQRGAGIIVDPQQDVSTAAVASVPSIEAAIELLVELAR